MIRERERGEADDRADTRSREAEGALDVGRHHRERVLVELFHGVQPEQDDEREQRLAAADLAEVPARASAASWA